MSAADRRTWTWIVVVVLLTLAPGAFLGLPGKSVVGAWRVLQGETPYRDFWSMYAPAMFYATALVLWVCGKQIAAPALVACLLEALTAGTVFATLRIVGVAARLANAVALVFGLSRFELAPELSSYPPAILLIACGWRRIALRLAGGEARQLSLAGALFGLAAAFKHDVAGYATLGAVAGLLASQAWARELSWRGAAEIALRIVAPAAAIVALLALWLAWVAGADAWRDLIEFPLGDFRIVRSEAYPGLLPPLDLARALRAEPGSLARARDVAEGLAEWGLANAPQYVFAASLVLLAVRRAGARTLHVRFAVLALTSMPLFWMAAHTQQNTHLDSLALLSALAGAALARDWASPRAWRATGLAIAALYAGSLAIRPASEWALVLRVWSRPVSLGLPAARGVFVSPRERDLYGAVADYVAANVPSDEPIHLGVARHDAIVINNPRFAYLVDRRVATRYHELHPGVTDRDDVQREMIAALEARGVRCAVIWRFGWPDETLDALVARRRAALPECGSTRLDEYFAEHFEPVLERGEYVVLRRRAAAPQASGKSDER